MKINRNRYFKTKKYYYNSCLFCTACEIYRKEMNFYRLIFDKVIYKHPNTTVIQTSKTDNSQNSGEQFLTKTNNEQASLNLLYKCTRTCTYKNKK